MAGPKGRPKSLILDLYGAYLRRLGGWAAVSSLITLMQQLGVDQQAVRSAVSRMSRRDLLLQETRNGLRGYRLSDEALAILEDGDRRIFSTMEPADLADGWVLVAFSVPEEERDRRHALRSRLTWLGFGNLSGGLWIAPRRMLPELRDTVRRMGFEGYVAIFDGVYRGFEELQALVRRSWDLDVLRSMYVEFVRECQPALDRYADVRAAAAGNGTEPDVDERAAFVDYTLILDHWRKLPYLDPGLPRELLPAGWEGRTAAELFFTLRELLEKPATRHVEREISTGALQRAR